jgi:hypothetical protein
VIAMGGGNGTPEIYEKWKSLGGGKNAKDPKRLNVTQRAAYRLNPKLGRA